jgi:hypothetical protein
MCSDPACCRLWWQVPVSPSVVRSCYSRLLFLFRRPSVSSLLLYTDVVVSQVGVSKKKNTAVSYGFVSVAGREVADPAAKTTLKPKLRLTRT